MFKKKVFLASLLILLAASVYSVHYAFQLPTAAIEHETLCTYTHKGLFNYTVYLKPNVLYNTTELKGEEEGTYFKNITDHVDVTFKYFFNCSEPANTTGNLTICTMLRALTNYGEKAKRLWEKPITISPNSTFTSKIGRFVVSFPLNITGVSKLIEKIENEVAVRSSDHELTLKANVCILAETDVGDINETFDATMTMRFRQGIIEVDDGLNSERTGSLTRANTVYHPWVDNYRLGSIILFGALLTSTSYASLLAYKDRKGDNPVKKILRKHRELIVHSTEEFGNKPEKTIVRVRSMEDLVNISEQTYKPIIHNETTMGETKQHRFYVLENEAVYEYCLEETSKQDEKRPQKSVMEGDLDRLLLEEIDKRIAEVRKKLEVES